MEPGVSRLHQSRPGAVGAMAYLRFITISLLINDVVIFGEAALSSDSDHTATSLLAEKEADLRTFVRAVETNSGNCEALATCNSRTSSCSRLACYKYGLQGDLNYKCLGVASNAICGTDCRVRNFDYTKSFIRRVDTFTPNIAHTVCTQRALDDVFRRSTIGDSTKLFRVFYAATDGTIRLYPGTDDTCDNDYDPRTRPWYKDSIFVPKGVTVLIDTGRSMNDKLVGAQDDQEAYLSKEVNAARAILKTLDDKDYVNFISFDKGGIKPAKSQRYSSELFNSFSYNLTTLAGGEIRENPSLANTSEAINAAIEELTGNTSRVPPEYLKVVIVLTSGLQYQNLSELNIPANTSVNVFLYNFLTTSQKPECNPTLRASTEAVSVKRLDNPGLFLQSFYSFLAKVHRSAVGPETIGYGEQHADFSGLDLSTLTLAKSAFGPNGELLGVVGIDFFQQRIEEQYNIRFQDIVIGARDHPKITFNSNSLNTSVCFNHTEICPSAQTGQGFLCGEKTGKESIGCCGNCTSTNTYKKEKILGSVFGSVFVIAVVAACACCLHKRAKRKYPF